LTTNSPLGGTEREARGPQVVVRSARTKFSSLFFIHRGRVISTSGSLVTRNGDQNIEDGLGGNAGNRRAADVLDQRGVRTACADDPQTLAREGIRLRVSL